MIALNKTKFVLNMTGFVLDQTRPDQTRPDQTRPDMSPKWKCRQNLNVNKTKMSLKMKYH